ncbi:MAG TPA: ATP-binding protein [Limnochordia bacterium]|nr:ATP-binding protein [Limnochordia bacterium]HPT93890.1 ATP-binding protein [Limnochordia bacterium]HPZ31709.1 ATP-binding protein [Limnochordia bacterium]HQD71498.1 ATP-binding protein [Limnochordia bacterium]HXK97638.1 ATP-binding protein [Limnochordia bacterium]
MHRPLLLRLTGLVLVVTLLSMGVTTFFVMLFARNTLIDNLYMDLESDAKLVGRWLDTTDWQNVRETMRHLSETTTRRVSILDLDGNIVADSYYPSEYFTNVSDYPEFQQALKEGVGTARRISESSNLEELYVAVRFPKGIVRLATTSQEITAPLSFLSQAAVVLTGIMGLMAFGIAYYINRNITEPLGEMLDLTRQLQVGEFSRRVLVRSTDEIGQLSRAFNELSQTLEEMFQTVHDRENKLNAILTSMEDAVLAVDTNYKLILANRRMAEMINEDVSSLMGKDLTEAFQSYQLVEVVSDTLSTGKAIDTEIRPELSSQQVLAVTSSPLEDEAGKTIGVVIVLRDVTELRLLESMRREFVANVSHELRTPLTSIKGFVETILNGKTDDEAFVQRYLSIVSGETDRMITLINDLLDLTKIESRRQKLVFEEVNLKEIFDDTITVLASKAEEREVAVENRLDDLIVLGNPKMLRQVAINLVDNAIKYNKQGGQVWIEAAVNDGIASISVTDTGIGIPSEHLERVFERFYRVDKGRSRQMGGTGLGLSIVKHIIERHKGRIWAESEYEQGTTITFTLQVAK